MTYIMKLICYTLSLCSESKVLQDCTFLYQCLMINQAHAGFSVKTLTSTDMQSI